MGKLSLKVVVGGRTYPLTVNEGEEAKVMKAAEDINRAIKLLQESYAVKDMQDLLAMSSLQIAAKSSSQQPNQSQVVVDYSDVESKLDELSKELDSLQ